ncbi:alpha-glucosidase [Catellatospora sp. TT07R-123]|uniref:glycoside hydrolase family 13 protein n=1 Tax=Catellatospora sp. TT07R-123 TaxID=2733863 RepID=UPI001B22FA8F|nr:glycoside hydrolase family 13 protein [Catellatospora sp. TT07R-123]GHJ49508.1 alpha-glucosidase [Catellatospora sp. TT07R-123]
MSRHSRPWWRDAVIYQVYPRSFADGDGDGIGDVNGLRDRLPYLRDLGIDAIWLSPWYVSPMADAGYDVADYRDIDPRFGSLAHAEAFLAEAHALDLRVIVDIVPNHCSDRHPAFAAALAAAPGAPERDLFWFRPGRGEHGDQPPNDWRSHFGGPAWTRVDDGDWYLHMFAPEQPDWNWDHPAVRADFETTLRFWLDRGVDGFRIDVADHLVKDPALPDQSTLDPAAIRPWRDQDGVHEIFRSWRAIADTYPQQAVFVGELWEPNADRFTRYLRPDELHTGFNFAFLACPWDALAFRAVIDETLGTHALVGAPATWVLSNHDVVRHVTRYGRADTSHSFAPDAMTQTADLALGTRRARAAALLSLALPGSAYVYQGEELGLPEVQDIAAELLQDPRWLRSGFTDRGRDGCRVPLPWSGTAKPYGFSPDWATADPWLPQPEAWAALSAQAQAGSRPSMLELYRRALHLRRTEPDLGDGTLTWLDGAGPAAHGVLYFRRGDGFACLVNLSAEPVPLPPHGYLLLASDPLQELKVAPDSAVWLRLV